MKLKKIQYNELNSINNINAFYIYFYIKNCVILVKDKDYYSIFRISIFK